MLFGHGVDEPADHRRAAERATARRATGRARSASREQLGLAGRGRAMRVGLLQAIGRI